MSETIESYKKTYEELLAEIDKIKNKCDELIKQNNKLISKYRFNLIISIKLFI